MELLSLTSLVWVKSEKGLTLSFAIGYKYENLKITPCQEC